MTVYASSLDAPFLVELTIEGVYTIMAASRINLVNPVRVSLINSGYSTVKVVNAVNAALGQLNSKGSEAKTGAGSVSKDIYKVSVSTVEKFTGTKTIPLQFDAWHSAIAKAHKVAEFDCVDLPAEFSPWLEKMKEISTEVDLTIGVPIKTK